MKYSHSLTWRMGPRLLILSCLCAASVRGQPPAVEAPPDVSLDEISADIERLDLLKALNLDVAQLEQLAAVANQLGEASKRIDGETNLKGLYKAMWEVRTNMLLERPGDPWAPMAELWETSQRRDEAFSPELEKATEHLLAEVLNAGQQRALARRGTAWARLDQCLASLATGFALEEEQWRGWRDETARLLAEVAAEISADTAKGVNDRVLAALIAAREKGAEHLKENLQPLRDQLVAIVLPEDKRNGQTPEEIRDRVRSMLTELLRDPRGRLLVREKLEAKKKK